MSEFTFEVQQNALDIVRNTSIDANFAECEAALTEMLAPYKTMVVTEDAVAGAKADRARIRKVASRIDDARKEVKRVYSEPLRLFEEKCKRLTGICAEADANLDGQIKAFEEKRKEEKIAELRRYFDANVGEASDYIHFDAIYNKRWENVTYSEEQAHIDIQREIAGCISAVNAIRTLRSPFETALLDYYRQTRDLAAVLAKNEQYIRAQELEEKRKAEAAARAAQEEAERQAREEAERRRNEEYTSVMQKAAEAVADAEKEDVTDYPVSYAEEPVEEREPKFFVDFRVEVTRAQLGLLKDFLTASNIRYGRVPKE